MIAQLKNEVTRELHRVLHWWQAAEAMVGFLNAYQLSGNTKYIDLVNKIWAYIQSNFIDLENGEWHWLVDKKGNISRKEDKAGPWKAPYHNGRMCLEVIRRTENLWYLLDFKSLFKLYTSAYQRQILFFTSPDTPCTGQAVVRRSCSFGYTPSFGLVQNNICSLSAQKQNLNKLNFDVCFSRVAKT